MEVLFVATYPSPAPEDAHRAIASDIGPGLPLSEHGPVCLNGGDILDDSIFVLRYFFMRCIMWIVLIHVPIPI